MTKQELLNRLRPTPTTDTAEEGTLQMESLTIHSVSENMSGQLGPINIDDLHSHDSLIEGQHPPLLKGGLTTTYTHKTPPVVLKDLPLSRRKKHRNRN